MHKDVLTYGGNMKRTNDNWNPMIMYCNNCAQKLMGYQNDEGITKYECQRCKCSLVSKQKGRRHTQVDIYAPKGQIALC